MPPSENNVRKFTSILSRESSDGLFMVVIFAADLPEGAVTTHDPRLNLAALLQNAAKDILEGTEAGVHG